MLQTETNTTTVERKIRSAFRHAMPGHRQVRTDFEHGQWWITDLHSGAQWSVCDSSDPSGFCFEQVTEGEEN